MFNKFLLLLIIVGLFVTPKSQAQIKLGLLVYNGGGDWYANPTSLKNLAQFCNQELKTNLSLQEAQVEIGSKAIFNYPFIHATGHGRIAFSDAEAKNLRMYLESGGFLHIDDNYGMNDYVKPEMMKVFPELEFQELPFTHPIYQQKFKFTNGVPKIHEHDGDAPKAWGLIYKGRLVCLYTFSSDLGDGWEDAEVHNIPPSIRLESLQMGANMIQYIFNN